MLAEIGKISLVLLGFIAIFLVIMQILNYKNLKKQRKRLEDLHKALKKGSKVVLLGGIHAKIVSINNDTAIVNISDNVDIKVDRSAISEIIKWFKEELCQILF